MTTTLRYSWDLVAGLPDARIVVIEDQRHLADVLVPEVVWHVLAFLRDER